MTTELCPDHEFMDLIVANCRPIRSVAVAIRELEGYSYAFRAVEGQQAGEGWSGAVQAPNEDVALLEVFCRLRADIGDRDRIRFLVSLNRKSLIWQHPKEIRAALPGCSVQGPSVKDGALMAAAIAGLPPEWAPREPATHEHQSSEPLTVATDGSVRRKFTGYGWLASDGQHGVHGAGHSKNIVGTSVVLIAELRAINEAVRKLPNRQLTVLCDSRPAISIVGRWMKGERVLPEGYTTERANGATAGLVLARNRIHLNRDRISIHWVPAHQGEPLNEGADALARLGSRYAIGNSGLSRAEYRERANGLAEGFAQEFQRRSHS